MRWLTNFLTSSIGKKIIMSLTGLFLISFLVVHLAGNLQLLVNDEGQSFNVYAKFMTTNPVIKFISYGLYTGILLHAVQGLVLWLQNRAARGSKGYARKVTRAVGTNSFAASNMAWLGILILIFLIIHMGDFWFAMKFGSVDKVTYEGYEEPVKNLFARVEVTFSKPIFVIIYILGMVSLAFHLLHGFQSAFQTLGLNHPKYTPFIKGVGAFIAVIVPILFAIIPIFMFLGWYPLDSFLH
ncbi:MAG: succinate dehydrogenase cytochrome b subunit [Bacteroidota bacterium]